MLRFSRLSASQICAGAHAKVRFDVAAIAKLPMLRYDREGRAHMTKLGADRARAMVREITYIGMSCTAEARSGGSNGAHRHRAVKAARSAASAGWELAADAVPQQAAVDESWNAIDKEVRKLAAVDKGHTLTDKEQREFATATEADIRTIRTGTDRDRKVRLAMLLQSLGLNDEAVRVMDVVALDVKRQAMEMIDDLDKCSLDDQVSDVSKIVVLFELIDRTNDQSVAKTWQQKMGKISAERVNGWGTDGCFHSGKISFDDGVVRLEASSCNGGRSWRGTLAVRAPWPWEGSIAFRLLPEVAGIQDYPILARGTVADTWFKMTMRLDAAWKTRVVEGPKPKRERALKIDLKLLKNEWGNWGSAAYAYPDVDAPLDGGGNRFISELIPIEPLDC